MSTVPPGLKLKEAAPPGLKLKAPEGPSKLRTGIIAGTQGLTSGFADEIGGGIGQFFMGGGVKPGAAAQPSPDDTPEIAAAKAQLNAPKPSNYETVRDVLRADAKAAEEAHPELYTGLEMAGGIAQSFVPAGSLAKGGGMIAKGARALSSPAGMGAINALGHAEGTAGEQALQTAGGAAFGKVADKALGGTANALKGAKKFVDGKKFESLAQWFKRKGTEAGDEIVAAAQKSKDKAVQSATGGMGAEAADIIRSRDVAKQAAEELASVNPELAKKLLEAADSPEALARLQGAAENYLPRLSKGLEKFEEKGAELAAAKARDPLEEAAKRGVKDVFLNDKSKKWYSGEAVRKGAPLAAGAVGYMLGDDENEARNGMLGFGLGQVGSIIAGGRGSKLVNDLRSPEVQRALAKGGKWTAEKLGGLAEGLVRPTVLEATDDIDEKYRGLAEWMRGHGQ
jgi:hypothetical protein